MFITQYIEKRRELKNIIILIYGIYFLFLGIGSIFYFIVINSIINGEILAQFDTYFITSIIIKGVGGFLFSLVIEFNIQKIWKTRYVVSISFIVLVVIIPFFLNTLVFYTLLNMLNFLFLISPLLFTIYFTRNTLGEVRRKLIIGLFGFLLMGFGLSVTSYGFIGILTTLKSFSFIYLSSRVLTYFGIILVMHGFSGYSFFLESQWKENLIALIVIDKERTTSLYHKNFWEEKLKEEEILAGGITGIVRIIKEFTTSKKDIDVINIENKLILLEHGKHIITALVVKKDLQHTRYILKQITSKFEIFFWDYWKSSDSSNIPVTPEEIHKPMEILLRDIMKL